LRAIHAIRQSGERLLEKSRHRVAIGPRNCPHLAGDASRNRGKGDRQEVKRDQNGDDPLTSRHGWCDCKGEKQNGGTEVPPLDVLRGACV
jgi:hypothetical protein